MWLSKLEDKYRKNINLEKTNFNEFLLETIFNLSEDLE